MRIALVLSSLCLLLGLGAVGLVLALTPRVELPPPSAAAPPVRAETRASDEGPQNPGDEVLARMDALSREVDELRAKLAALEAGAQREPAAESAAPTDLGDSPEVYAAVHRDAILKVIEEDRLAQQRKREEEQRARDLQAMLARAERTAKRFGLNADQQKSLADVYLLERTKLEDFRTQMREQGGFGGDPESMRTSFQELRDWRLNELTVRLGADLAQQINDSEVDRFREAAAGGRRGNRGQGGGGGDGQGENTGRGGF